MNLKKKMTEMNFPQFLVNEKRKSKYYSSLQIEPPEEISDNIISWGFDYVPSESLLLDPKDLTFGREEDIHITLIYGIHTEDINEVTSLFAKEKEFECKLGKIDVFTKNSKFDVLIITVDCEELHYLNRKLRKEIEFTENYPVFVPHVTICYLKKGQGTKYVGDEFFLGEKFKVSNIIFSSKTGVKTPIPLGLK